jgi:hypothetical protein
MVTKNEIISHIILPGASVRVQILESHIRGRNNIEGISLERPFKVKEQNINSERVTR